MLRAITTRTKGLTLIELLVAISIISLLSSIVVASLQGARSKARDSERIQTLQSFEIALELYYTQYEKYPGWNNGGSDIYPGGSGSYCYATQFLQPDNSCADSDFGYENSASVGFLDVLSNEGLIGISDWNDPKNPHFSPESGLKWNCRYIVPREERDANNVQRYAMHCRLENPSFVAQNDGGTNPYLFEIQKPTTWLCIDDNPVEISGPSCN
ncbi:prepilin-type N-terminal cleavage/methylation domain-containing protein [Candidatus Giovannonibacteria bacterium]|nr:prepilin-type N-terminal cleavage/methylation domain-containing protein [Candidatus Giovannonibacteria bacterium]